MDFITQFRRTYLGAAPHTFYTAAVWLTGGLVGEYISHGVAIWVFILGASFTFPLGELLRQWMHAPNVMSSENKLGKLFMLSAFGIPLCYPLIYLTCRANVNFFFPAFSILVGAHYLIFIYGYGLNSFGVVAVLLVGIGSITAILYPENFSLSAYGTALVLTVFGIYHYIKVKLENHESIA